MRLELPEGINPKGIEASYKDGVLEISVPKPTAREPKTVKVQIK